MQTSPPSPVDPLPIEHRRTAGLLYAFAAFAFVMLAMAIVGTVRSYSVVPFYDMWEGCIGFFEQLDAGDRSGWWQLHNEHRIVWARVLFLIDRAWFGDAGRFLVAMNLLLAGAGAYSFWRILLRYQGGSPPDDALKALGLCFVPLLFSWAQEENLTWAFQSQFFLVQLLPLLALCLLYRSVTAPSGRTAFVAACLLGGASAGTMANGLLILPLMTFYAGLMGQRKARITILLLLSVSVITLYLRGYRTVERHESLTTLVDHPLLLPRYLLAYLGSPFSFVFGDAGRTRFAYVGGLLLLSITVLSTGTVLRRPRAHPLRCALLVFLLFVYATALVTAVGRLRFGPSQALSSRYTTPVLMAWATILVLHSNGLLTAFRTRRKPVLICVAVVALLMLRCQLPALRSQSGKIFEHDLSALALELGVSDTGQIDRIVNPDQSSARTSVDAALAGKLSIFGRYPLADMRLALGRRVVVDARASATCEGEAPRFRALVGEGRFQRVEGAVRDGRQASELDHATLVSADGDIAGYVVYRPAGLFFGRERPSEFGGYVLTAFAHRPLFLIGPTIACSLPMQAGDGRAAAREPSPRRST